MLDGRHRLEACRRAGVDPTFITLAPTTDPYGYVVSANLHRRHLSESQRAMIAAKLAERHAGEAHERSLANLRRGQAAERANLPGRAVSEQIGRPRDIAAAQLAVSGRIVQDALTVRRNGSPELIEAVESGEAARSVPIPVHRATISRWSQLGVRGVKLASDVIGGRRVTSREALDRFLAECRANRWKGLADGARLEQAMTAKERRLIEEAKRLNL